jgi:lipid A 3-O-deacylase
VALEKSHRPGVYQQILTLMNTRFWGDAVVAAIVHACIPALFLVLATPPAFAQTSESSGTYDGVQIFVENDKFNLFRASDQWYTNGFRVVTLPRKAPHPLLQDYADWVGRKFGDGKPARFGLTIGQDIYTPKDITISAPQPYDRPWAGWLYLGAIGSLNVKPTEQHSIELDVGVVGPASGANAVQTQWHRLINTDLPRGWQHQIKNELGVVFNYRIKHRKVLFETIQGGVELDLIPHYGGAIGNVFTHAQGGAMLRYGRHISGFGDDRASDTVRGSGRERNPATVVSELFRINEWYVFARAEGKLVARNIFLDGNTFRSSASVKKRPFVGDVGFGGSLRFGDRLRVTYTQTIRSQEFKPVELTPKGDHRFSSVVLAYEF